MVAALNLVVTCTERKKSVPPAALQVRNLGSRSRLATWISRLENEQVAPVRAFDLYAGDHWSVVRGLPKVACSRSIRINIWVCSAGYGLVPATARIKPYSATFSAHKADSVISTGHYTDQAWWEGLASWRGPDRTAPRSLLELAKRFPKVPLMIAASERYLNAVDEDLRLACDALRTQELLVIFSAGAGNLRALNQNLVPAGAPLKQDVGGGSMHSLNVRLVRHAIETLSYRDLRASSLIDHFSTLLERAPEMPKHDRQPMDDNQVRAFIRSELQRNPKARHSPLLRQLRDSGRACEQKRFAELFQRVKAEVDSGN